MKIEHLHACDIVDKFGKWLNRTICTVLREHNVNGKIIVDKINLQDRPDNIYSAKVFLEALEIMLPDEDGIIGMPWYLRIRKDMRKWKGVFETLTQEDYTDMSVDDIADIMIHDSSKINELMDIMNTFEEEK